MELRKVAKLDMPTICPVLPNSVTTLSTYSRSRARGALHGHTKLGLLTRCPVQPSSVLTTIRSVIRNRKGLSSVSDASFIDVVVLTETGLSSVVHHCEFFYCRESYRFYRPVSVDNVVAGF